MPRYDSERVRRKWDAAGLARLFHCTLAAVSAPSVADADALAAVGLLLAAGDVNERYMGARMPNAFI